MERRTLWWFRTFRTARRKPSTSVLASFTWILAGNTKPPRTTGFQRSPRTHSAPSTGTALTVGTSSRGRVQRAALPRPARFSSHVVLDLVRVGVLLAEAPAFAVPHRLSHLSS